MKEHHCRHSCYSCLVAGTKQSSGDSGCTVRTIVLCQRSSKNKHPTPSNSFKIVVALLFWSSAMLDVIDSIEQLLKL